MNSTTQAILLQAYIEKRVLLVRYFTRLASDAAQAEDVVQDLYLKISAMQSETEVGDATAFLFKMAHNIYLNQLRSRQSGRNRDQAWHDTRHHHVGTEPVDDTPTAEDQVASRQQMILLQNAIEELPERTQAIFRLHKLEGVSQPEVAARLSISLSSVEKHLSQALRHLTTRLRPRNRAGP